MIEIVAQALWDHDGRFDADNQNWKEAEPELLSAYRDRAKASIVAMREPSDAMLAAGVVHDDATYSTWCAMIDTAMAENEK